jgi:hypothetical protein
VAKGLNNKSSILIRLWKAFHDQILLDRAVAAGREAMLKGAGCYNLACASALAGDVDEAFALLEQALSNSEILWAHVAKNDDWSALRDDPRFRLLEELYEAHDPER